MHLGITTVYAADRTTKRTMCEKCGTKYSYPMFRLTQGQSLQIAQELGGMAQKTARRNIKQALENEEEICPCPRCGWVQASMIRSVRQIMGAHLFGLCLVWTAMSALFGAAFYFILNPPPGSKPAETVMLVVSALCFTLIAWGPMIIGWVLFFLSRSRINPNADFDGKPRPVPGSMPSFWDWPSPDAYENPDAFLMLKPGNPAEPAFDKKRLVTCLPMVPLPDYCAACCEPQPQNYIVQRINQLKLPIPVCAACYVRHKTRKKLWVQGAIGTGAILGICMIGAIIAKEQGLGNLFSAGNALPLIGGSLLAGVISGMIASRAIPKPLKFRVINTKRGITSIKPENAQYFDHLTQACLYQVPDINPYRIAKPKLFPRDD